MREPKQSPAERRRQQESARQPDRDRTAHEAARGVKKGKRMTLAHLTRAELTSEEFDAALSLMVKETDRGLAIMGAALVEEVVTDALKGSLVNKEDEDALFYDHGAPFGTFRAKTVALYALGLCEKQTREDIDAVRNIRNQFSHSLRPLTFKNPDIAAACERFMHYAEREAVERGDVEDDRARYLYFSACAEIYTIVSKNYRASMEAKLPITQPNALAALFESVASSGQRGGENVSYDLGADQLGVKDKGGGPSGDHRRS